MWIESALYMFEFAHFEQIIWGSCSVWFVEVLLRYVIVCHGRSFSVSSWVVKTYWLGSFSQDIILLCNLFLCNITVIIADNISHWSTWSIWSSIGVLLFWQKHSIIWEIMSKSWHIIRLSTSVCCLSSWGSCKRSEKCIFINFLEISFILWLFAGFVSCPDGSY